MKGLIVKTVELYYSKTRIDKAGERLKENPTSENDISDALKILSNWRAYHAQ